MKLYTYFRSTAAYRVRIVLELKEIECEYEYVNLKKGEQKESTFGSINPQNLVPTLNQGSGQKITQSLAIIDYLEQLKPTPSIYPTDHDDLFYVKDIALAVACDIHPLNNLRVLRYLGAHSFAKSEEEDWYHNWLKLGFDAIEEKAKNRSGRFLCKDQITIADICLIPQIYNAHRFNFDMSGYPTLSMVYENCSKIKEFIRASPEQQKDCDL